MTAKQKEKELQRQTVLFEEQVKTGQFLNGANLSFSEFIQIWLTDYAEKRLAPGTIKPYKTRLVNRVIPALGHIKLSKLQPHHLMEFYNNLQESDIRLDTRYIPTGALIKLLEKYKTPELVK